MINKTSIFASGGAKDTTKTEANFREGMLPNHVAMAEDVNIYGNMSDTQLWVICRELVNLLALYGITPDGNVTQTDPNDPTASQNQLATMFTNNVVQPASLTGIVKSSYTTPPTQVGNSISFPAMDISYNLDVYYGDTMARQHVVSLAATTISANNTWALGPHFIYAYAAPTSTTATIMSSQTPIAAKDGATQCFLGSVYVMNDSGNRVFQPGTWKFQPWLQITSQAVRESPFASTKGGFIAGYQGSAVQMGKLEIMAEGINFDTDPTAPSIVDIPAETPFTYKSIYPGYNSSAADVTAIDTTHIYDHSTGQLDTLTPGPTPTYIVLVPCITPAGQTLIIMPQANVGGQTYMPVFDTMQEARDAIFGLKYSFSNNENARCIYLGQSMIVKVGATDMTDPSNLLVVGVIPQELGGFTTASGQTGGSSGVYTPMPKYDFTGSTAFTARNNAANIAGGANEEILITLPTPDVSVLSQFEVYYTHTSTSAGISFRPSGTFSWWYDRAPIFNVGRTYLIVGEYIGSKWRLGFIEGAN